MEESKVQTADNSTTSTSATIVTPRGTTTLKQLEEKYGCPWKLIWIRKTVQPNKIIIAKFVVPDNTTIKSLTTIGKAAWVITKENIPQNATLKEKGSYWKTTVQEYFTDYFREL